MTDGRRLDGKRVLITGAAQGIGWASGVACAQVGAELVGVDLHVQAPHAWRDAGFARFEALDVSDADAVARLLGGIGRVDVLFNCAGTVAHGSVLDCTPADWDRSFRVNVASMFHTIRAVLPAMLDQGGGSIVNMASVVSSVKGAPDRAAYGASKAAVVGLTKSVAADYVGRGIHCNAICPGTVTSPSLEGRIDALAERLGGREAAVESFVRRQPMGRLGTPAEIAELVVYLASDASAYMTGSVLVVDGGWSL